MKWLDPQPVNASPEISAAFSGSILLAEQLAQRGIEALPQAQAYLDPDVYQPASPFDFPDMPTAVERVQSAIRNKQTIGIWGDFDVGRPNFHRPAGGWPAPRRRAGALPRTQPRARIARHPPAFPERIHAGRSGPAHHLRHRHF